MMDLQVSHQPVAEFAADAVVAIAFEGESGHELGGDLAAELYSTGEFSGKSGEIVTIHRPAGLSNAKRLVLAGGGKKEKFDSARLRTLAGAVLRTLKARGLHEIALVLPADLATEENVAAAAEGALIGDFESHSYKTDPKRHEQHIAKMTILAPGSLERAAERGRIIGEAQNFARVLGNEPPNKLTPTVLAQQAEQMAKANGLSCEILDGPRMQQLGMGALLGVSQGSAEPPALIILRYTPANAKEGVHIGLVGKAVTFDTGGISIKPSEGMEQMKFDMCGGAAVLGAMQAIAQLKPAITVTAFVPAVENMPGSRAQRPGDIVKSYSGKTIEILNTDAEGRLILADAITYAKQQGCTHLVDSATLTGAIVMALGRFNTGAFTNNEEFAAKVMKAAKAEGEKMWLMPMDEDYKDQLKSAFADIPNIGTKGAGSITAALFLQEFVGDTPWVHFDIAGTGWIEDSKPYMTKGPTGVCTRTFVRLVEDLS